jgi:hypothetical protein
MLSIKSGVTLSGLKSEVILAALVMDQVYTQYGINDCVITCGLDGKHIRSSKHYIGHALDFGIKKDNNNYLDSHTIEKLAEVSQKRLGDDFDIIVEQNHIHCEFDPK